MKTSMKTILTSLFFIGFTFISNAQTSSPDFEWVKQAGGSNYDYVNGISTDNSGNSYITGRFVETATFGGTTLTSAGSYDVFIAKLDANGNLLWAKQAGGSRSDNGYGISTDNSGNSYITGYFRDTATFGGTTLTSAGGTDIFIAKLDANGNLLWAKQAGGSGSDNGLGISTDNSGNCYITGVFMGTATFGNTTLTSAGDGDIFIAKLDANGNFLWTKQAGGSGDDHGWGISTDNAGNSYITGQFWVTATFGGTTLTSAGGFDIFIAKLDANGNFLWAKQAGGSGDGGGLGISTDNSGNSYITGIFGGTATFGGTTLTSAGLYDIFIAKLDANGNFLWTKQAGGSTWDLGRAISTDNSGNCFITGDFGETATFGGTTLTSAGLYDIFIAKLDANGNFLWAKQAGGSNREAGQAITTDNSGNCYITGEFQETATFGGTTLTSAGDGDIFIAKISETTASITEENIQKEIMLYPNPAREQLNLVAGNEQIKKIIITDLNGKNFLQKITEESSVMIDVSMLSKGMYLVQIVTESGRVTKPFVKE